MVEVKTPVLLHPFSCKELHRLVSLIGHRATKQFMTRYRYFFVSLTPKPCRFQVKTEPYEVGTEGSSVDSPMRDSDQDINFDRLLDSRTNVDSDVADEVPDQSDLLSSANWMSLFASNQNITVDTEPTKAKPVKLEILQETSADVNLNQAKVSIMKINIGIYSVYTIWI
jgi:hypothetical protein